MDIQTDLEEKKLFFVNSEILRIQIWQKKGAIDDKLEIATKQH